MTDKPKTAAKTDVATFTNDFFRGNRQRLRQAVQAEYGDLLIIITANGLLQRNNDAGFPFRQDSNFWYLTGIDKADVILVIKGDEEYLILPARDAIHETFDGALSPSELSECSGVVAVYDERAGWDMLRKNVHGQKRVASLSAPSAYIEGINMYANPARARLLAHLQEIAPDMELQDIRPMMAQFRMVKQTVELAAIQRAIDITIDGLQAITTPGRLQGYQFEYEAEADLSQYFRRQRSRHAFEPIVAGGKRACQLHYIENNSALAPGELLGFDVGAEVDNYAADISRVYARSQPTERQQEVYDAVCRVQDYALEQLKPGVMPKEYEKLVESFMGEQLRALGVIHDAEPAHIRQYFPHATSHFLGLDTHDVGDYRQPLPVGSVLTCEPGIYIPEEGIGVRIEDDVLITADGPNVLSQRLPRRLW